jgi:hypothetical protein
MPGLSCFLHCLTSYCQPGLFGQVFGVEATKPLSSRMAVDSGRARMPEGEQSSSSPYLRSDGFIDGLRVRELTDSKVLPRSGLQAWSRIWSSCAPQGLQILLCAPLYAIDNIAAPGFTLGLLPPGVYRMLCTRQLPAAESISEPQSWSFINRINIILAIYVKVALQRPFPRVLATSVQSPARASQELQAWAA